MDRPIDPKVSESIARLRKAKESSEKHRTPRAVLDAFLPPVIVAGKIEIPTLNMGKVILLESIGSPFLQGSKTPSMKEITETLFALVQPSDLVREAIGAGVFGEAVIEWTETLSPSVFAGCAVNIIRAINAAFDTATRYQEEGAGSPLAPSPSPETGSGGS